MPENVHEFWFRSTSDGVLISDAAGCIQRINPAAAAMLGLPVEEALNSRVETLFMQNPTLLNLFLRSGSQTLEVRLPKRRLAVGVGDTLEDGRRIVLLQDITEKQDLESRREALIATMAHDLRNPISAISGFAELIEKFGDLNPQQQKFIHRIRQTSSKVYEVVAPLVDLSWIEAGMPLAHRPIQASDLIQKEVNKLLDFARERQVTLVTSVQKPLPVVMGDAMRLGMAIHHLIHNAILYSLAEQNVAVHAWGDTHELYFSVADRGIGIADDELEMIFDRLYRSRDSRVRDLPGGGLGLTIARTIILRHGGDLWASSNLNVGSTFTFVLPVVNAQNNHHV
jgi:signal transduction histidine kinase